MIKMKWRKDKPDNAAEERARRDEEKRLEAKKRLLRIEQELRILRRDL